MIKTNELGQQTIGKTKALELFDSKWWEGKTPKEIATFQMHTAELCMPFSEFHDAVEKALDRPVFTHEFALNHKGLIEELSGEKTKPNLEDIINLIPEAKRIILAI